MTDVPLDMDFVLNYDSIVTRNLQNAYYITERDFRVCKDRAPNVARLIVPFVPAEKLVEPPYSRLTVVPHHHSIN